MLLLMDMDIWKHLLCQQSSWKSSVLTAKISLGPPFEGLAPVPLSDCLFREKNVHCGMLSDSHIIALVPDVSRLNFSIVNDQLDTSKNKI
jgi:hypothetical protein